MSSLIFYYDLLQTDYDANNNTYKPKVKFVFYSKKAEI